MMEDTLSWPLLELNRQHVLTHWLVTEVVEEPIQFVPVTMTGEVNRWLIEGFSIHENPARRQFVSARAGAERICPVDTAGAVPGAGTWNVYFPWENPRVERSGFWFVPTHLTMTAVASLVCGSAHRATMRLRTCGAVSVWVNRTLAADFHPFTRNIEQVTSFVVKLLEGANEVVARLEDIAERDTLFYFRLDYEGTDQPTARVPAGSADPGEVLALEQALLRASFPRDVVRAGRLTFSFDNPVPREVTCTLSFTEATGGVASIESIASPGSRVLDLCDVQRIGMGFRHLRVSTRVGPVLLSKDFGVEAYPEVAAWAVAPQDIAARKERLLTVIARNGESSVHTAIARMARDQVLSREAQSMLLDGIKGIRRRRDCSDFDLVDLFRLCLDERFVPMASAEVRRALQECILGFRYWIDEPGSDVMWFFSENHALLFHTCELLAGQLFPAEVFSNSGLTGSEHRGRAAERLSAWFERFEAEGLAEWNSPAYIPIDVAGLVALHDLAADPWLRQRAARALDRLFRTMCLNSHRGALAATFGRGYEKELKGHYTAGTSSLLWAGYGIGFPNAYAISNVAFCLSNYAPPEDSASYLSPAPGRALSFRYQQGKDGYARLSMWKTAGFALSSVYDYRPGKKGYQEHVVHAALTAEAQVWVNHPGELARSGFGRPSFWAGNGVLPKVGQYRGVCLILYRIPAELDALYTHAYFPVWAFEETRIQGRWAFGRSGGGCVGMYAANGLSLQSSGPDEGRELVSEGGDNAWVVRAADLTEYGSFSAFVAESESASVEVRADEGIRMRDPRYGDLRMDFQAPLTVNGREELADGGGVEGIVEWVELGAGRDDAAPRALP